MIWVAFALLMIGAAIGGLCLLLSHGPVYQRSVLDPSIGERRGTCWVAAILIVLAMLLAFYGALVGS
jgi:hypothetical protein